MSVSRFLSPLLVSLLMVSGALAASLDSARELYDSGDLDAAGSELQELLGSSTDDTIRADALNLLGTIAVDRQEWNAAHESWSRLLADYPESAAAGEARVKLTLVGALMDAQGDKPAAPPSPAPEPTPAPAATPPAPREPAVETPAPSPVPRQTAPAAPAAAVAPVTPAPEKSNLVMVAGRGKPYDAVAESTRRLLEWLDERGVNAESATTGVAVVQDSDVVLAQLLVVARERGAHSLLYLDARYADSMAKVKYFLYQPDGSLLWSTKVTGGTGWTGEPYSKSGIGEKLFHRSLVKLGKRVGGPGLPVE